MASSPNTSSLVLNDAMRRRASCISDCGLSECSSAPSAGGSPTVRAEVLPHSQTVSPCLVAAGSPPQPRLAVPRSPMTPPPRRGSEPATPRPLCLDFLNGKCGRQRAHCRYYHPQPGEVTLVVPPTASPEPAAPVDPAVAGTVNDPSRPICEVWALTGFCKYGPRCWKQHPQLAAQLASPVSEPITHKFQQWLQSRLQEPSSPALTSGRTSAPSPTSRRSSMTSFETPRSPLSDGNSSSGLLTLALERLKNPSGEEGSTNSPLSTGRSQSLSAPADPTSSGLRVIALRSGRAPASAAAPPAGPPGPAEPPFVHQPYAL